MAELTVINLSNRKVAELAITLPGILSAMGVSGGYELAFTQDEEDVTPPLDIRVNGPTNLKALAISDEFIKRLIRDQPRVRPVTPMGPSMTEGELDSLEQSYERLRMGAQPRLKKSCKTCHFYGPKDRYCEERSVYVPSDDWMADNSPEEVERCWREKVPEQEMPPPGA